MRPVVPRDLANEQIDVNQFYACLAATGKHVMANAYLPEMVAEQRALAEMLAGGADSLDRRPLISYTACWTVSPLDRKRVVQGQRVSVRVALGGRRLLKKKHNINDRQ